VQSTTAFGEAAVRQERQVSELVLVVLSSLPQFCNQQYDTGL